MATVRKAVITAAGRGTRMYPASAAVPKEMFPLVDRDGLPKPVIQLIVEEAIDSGIEEVCIVVPPGGEAKFRDYFRQMKPEAAAGFRGKDWAFRAADRLAQIGERLRFAVQTTPDGFGHAVYQTKAFAGNDPILLLLGDHIHVSGTAARCARQLIGVYERQPVPPASVTGVQPTPERLLHLFGTIQGTPVGVNEPGVYRAQNIVEKPSIDLARQQLITPGLPAGQFLAHFGMWIFSPAIFDSLAYHIDNNRRDGGEFQLTAAQEHLRAQHPSDYLVAVLNGRRYDTGVPQGVIEAQLALALNGIHQRETRDAIDRLLPADAAPQTTR